LDDGLNAGLYDGLNDGLYAGLYAGLNDGLNAGLRAALNDGLYAGLYAGLNDGLDAGLDAASKRKDFPIKYMYCGVFWGWWCTRYLIAAQWGCELDWQKLALLYAFVRFCPLVGYQEIDKDKAQIVILPKPKIVRWKENGKTEGKISLPIFELHGEAKPSAEYPALNFNLYHFRNIKVPQRMGNARVSDWKSEWLLDEGNSEIRRLLIQQIGYERICAELKAKEISRWREYELLEVEGEVDVEPIRLLKMTCPSTQKIHVLRTPPDIGDAKEAITWCNHGVDPESFVMEH
jgi:hypothetical protein